MVLQSKLFCCSVYSLRLTVGNHGRVSYYLVAKAIARKKCLGGGGDLPIVSVYITTFHHFPRSALLKHRSIETRRGGGDWNRDHVPLMRYP